MQDNLRRLLPGNMVKWIIIVLLVISSCCIWSVGAFHSVKRQLQQRRSSPSRWRRTAISFSNEDQFLQTSILLNEGETAVLPSSGGRNWFLQLVDRIPLPDMSSADSDSSKIDLIGSVIGIELTVLGVLCVLLGKPPLCSMLTLLLTVFQLL